jgi:hypothetical protein
MVPENKQNKSPPMSTRTNRYLESEKSKGASTSRDGLGYSGEKWRCMLVLYVDVGVVYVGIGVV